MITQQKNATLPTELDLAYNSSISVSNSAEITQAWVDASQVIRERLQADLNGSLNVALNVAYGPGTRQCFDFFSAGNNTPVVVFVHGGFWQMRCKEDFMFIVPTLLKHGISVAMLGYTLAPEADMANMVKDVRMGLDAIEQKVRNDRQTERADAFETIPGFCLLGWSAGAQLVAATIDQPNVHAGVCVSGIYDLEPMRHCYVNEKLQLDADAALQFSPIKQTNHFGKPLELFVGGAELPAMQMQTNNFYTYRQLQAQLGEYTLLDGLNHYTVFDELVNEDGAVLKAIQKTFC
jgi:arylformamidase